MGTTATLELDRDFLAVISTRKTLYDAEVYRGDAFIASGTGRTMGEAWACCLKLARIKPSEVTYMT